MRLTHVRVLVDDFERMAEFYGTALGFERTVDATSIGYAEFAAGDAILAIYDRARMTWVVGEHEAARFGCRTPSSSGGRTGREFDSGVAPPWVL